MADSSVQNAAVESALETRATAGGSTFTTDLTETRLTPPRMTTAVGGIRSVARALHNDVDDLHKRTHEDEWRTAATQITLYAADRADLAFEFASGHVDPDALLSEFDPDWRERYRSSFEVFDAGDDVPDWDALYRARGDEVSATRPVFTADVFTGVQLSGSTGKTKARSVIVLQHPCSMRTNGVDLAWQVLVARCARP